jgi:hypothetical protein
VPKTPAPVVGPSDCCPVCGTSKPKGTARCTQCFVLFQVVSTHAVKLLRDPKSAQAVRDLFHEVLTTPIDPPKEGA